MGGGRRPRWGGYRCGYSAKHGSCQSWGVPEDVSGVMTRSRTPRRPDRRRSRRRPARARGGPAWWESPRRRQSTGGSPGCGGTWPAFGDVTSVWRAEVRAWVKTQHGATYEAVIRASLAGRRTPLGWVLHCERDRRWSAHYPRGAQKVTRYVRGCATAATALAWWSRHASTRFSLVPYVSS